MQERVVALTDWYPSHTVTVASCFHPCQRGLSGSSLPQSKLLCRAYSSPVTSNRSSSSAAASPFVDITNTPVSKPFTGATSASKIPKPSPLGSSRGASASGSASQIPKKTDSLARSASGRVSDGGHESRRSSQGLAQLQMQLQDVIIGGKQIQVGCCSAVLQGCAARLCCAVVCCAVANTLAAALKPDLADRQYRPLIA